MQLLFWNELLRVFRTNGEKPVFVVCCVRFLTCNETHLFSLILDSCFNNHFCQGTSQRIHIGEGCQWQRVTSKVTRFVFLKGAKLITFIKLYFNNDWTAAPVSGHMSFVYVILSTAVKMAMVAHLWAAQLALCASSSSLCSVVWSWVEQKLGACLRQKYILTKTQISSNIVTQSKFLLKIWCHYILSNYV